MNREQIEIVKNIGKGDLVDIFVFIPKFPDLSESEYIFKIGYANAKRYIDEEVEFFVKGLHLIELEYRVKVGSDFGFGSPSPTVKVISALERLDPVKAQKLTEWVALNGGNYYIEKI